MSRMRIVGITGDHPRHRFVANRLSETGMLTGLVVQEREKHIPEPPDHLSPDLSTLFTHHFERRAEAEKEFFGNPSLPEVPTLTVSSNELNGDRTRQFISDQTPDLTLTYGVGILSDETLSTVPGAAWNVHAGLVPEYRGVITHFWPSYMLEPQMTGMTLHEIESETDAGSVIHQTGAVLSRGDGIHQLASRTVKAFARELPEVLDKAAADELTPPERQTSAGKLWRSRDWRPDHLRVIYEKFDNSIVDLYLDGAFEQHEPDLARQI